MPTRTARETMASLRMSTSRSRAALSTWRCASAGMGTLAAAARTSATTDSASRPPMSATTSTLRITWSWMIAAGSAAMLTLATSPSLTWAPDGVSTFRSRSAEMFALIVGVPRTTTSNTFACS